MENAYAVMQDVKTVMLNNPGTTVLILSSATVIAMPALVASPALVAAGFTASGPAAGGFAAGVQVASTAAHGVFATCQSAAMGGYGVAIINGAVQGAGLATAGSSVAFNWVRSRL